MELLLNVSRRIPFFMHVQHPTINGKPSLQQPIFFANHSHIGYLAEKDALNQIVYACAAPNYKQQTQSAATHFLCKPLVSHIGQYLAEKDASNQILAGTYQIPQTVDHYTDQ
jgi:hypothetical protein